VPARRFVRIPHVLTFFRQLQRDERISRGGMIVLVWLYVAGLAYLIRGQINAEIERTGKRISSNGVPM